MAISVLVPRATRFSKMSFASALITGNEVSRTKMFPFDPLLDSKIPRALSSSNFCSLWNVMLFACLTSSYFKWKFSKNFLYLENEIIPDELSPIKVDICGRDGENHELTLKIDLARAGLLPFFS